MSVKNRIDKEVLLTIQKYDKKLNKTELTYFRNLLEEKSPQEMLEYLNKEYTIDHTYMIKAIDEVKQIIMKKDKIKKLELLRQVIPNLLEINPIEDFKRSELDYAQRVLNKYTQDLADIKTQKDKTKYLTTKIKTYSRNVEQYIPYFHNGFVWSMQNLATYNSMLYNVNLTRTAWNQSYKDSILLENDKFIINTHPFACPHCLQHQGKIYTRQELEDIVGIAVEDGAKEILHPNCKCTLSIYWDKSQLERQNKTTEEDYRLDQKAKSLQRQINKRRTEKQAFEDIGNEEMADERRKQLSRMYEELRGIKGQMETIRKRFYKY
jgi:hypothetical protein